MGQDRKITELAEITGDSFPNNGNILIPLADGDRNKSLSMSTLYIMIRNLIRLEIYLDKQSLEGDDSGLDSGQTIDLSTVVNRLSNVESEVQAIKSPSNWPKNKIILDRGANMDPIPYTLPTGYQDTGVVVTIHDSQAALPNFYVLTSIGVWDISNSRLTFRVDVSVKSCMDTLQLSGGTIGTIQLVGTYIANNQTFELSPINISDLENTSLSNSSCDTASTYYTYDIPLLTSTNAISQISIRTRVSGVEVSQPANRLSGGTNSDGMGLITLTS